MGILAVFKEQNGIGIITDWLGTEGYSTEYLKEEGDESDAETARRDGVSPQHDEQHGRRHG